MGEDPWKALPVTFHITQGENDNEWNNFLEYFYQIKEEIKQKTKEKEES